MEIVPSHFHDKGVPFMFSKLKLKSKMLLSIGTVVVIAFVVTIALVSKMTNAAIKKEAFEKSEYLSVHYSNMIKEKIEAAMGVARNMAHTYEGIYLSKEQPDTKILDASLKQIVERNPGFSGAWVMIDPETIYEKSYAPWYYRDKGKILFDATSPEDYQGVTGENYYALPKKTKKEVLLEPYMEPTLKIPMTSASVPIIVENRCIGVVGIDLELGGLSDDIKKIKPYETGFASLIANNGKYVAHPDKKNIDKDIGDTETLKEAKAAIKSGKKFKMYYHSDVLETDVYRIFVPTRIGLSENSWSFSVVIPMEKVLAGAKKITYTCILIGVVSVVLASLAVFFMAGTIIKPINRAVVGLKDISEGEGDLTTRLPVTTQDEVGQLSKNFNKFIEKLQKMIADISQGVETLSSSSTEMSSIAKDMSNSSGQTSDRANTVAAAAEEMNANMNSVAAAMEQSSTNINTVASAADEMNSTINEIAQNAEKAREVTLSAVSKADESTGIMNELRDSAKAIGKVVETITDISEQVNLLSLNATIEAARAGEAGKGFAVVANEIKDLAKQTSDASMDIKTKIDSIQQSSAGSLASIEEISKVIAEVSEIVATIATAVEEQSAATNEISQNISQASSGIEEVNSNVNQSSTVSAEITKDISGVNESSTEISERSDQVNLSAEDLSKLAESLNEMVGRFKI